MELVDKIFFHKRYKRRRETLPTVTGLRRCDIEAIQEEPESDNDNENEESATNEVYKRTVGKRLAHFKEETCLCEKDHSEELQGHNNGSFQPDFVQSVNIAELDIQKFGEKGKESGQFDDATHVTYVSKGRTLITDLTNNRIQLCTKTGRALMLYTGDEVAEPWASALTADGHIAVTSCRNKCVKILNEDGDILNTFGTGFFQRPTGIAVDSDGRFIVTDSLAHRVSIHNSNGDFIEYLGRKDEKDGCFTSPRYVCLSVNGDIIISDTGNHCVKIFTKKGSFVTSFGKFGSDNKSFKFPHGVCTSKYGDILVADHYNNRLSLFSRRGVFIRHLVTSTHGLSRPKGITLSPDFTLYVTHGDLKATEILVIKLRLSASSDYTYKASREIVYV